MPCFDQLSQQAQQTQQALAAKEKAMVLVQQQLAK